MAFSNISGHLKHQDATTIGFTHTHVSIIHHDSRIVDVYGIPKESSDLASDGWFLSEFCIF